MPSKRRAFLSGTGAMIGVTLAGCLGGGGDDSSGGDVVMHMGSTGTSSYAAAQGLASVVNEQSDSVSIDVRPGTLDGNIGEMQRGNSDSALFHNYMAEMIREENEPFNNIDVMPLQMAHFYDLDWILLSRHSDMESVTDIQSNHRVSPVPAGSLTRNYLERALDHAGVEYEGVSVDFAEQGSAMAEGRLDVGIGMISNQELEAGWMGDLKSQNTPNVLTWPDDVAADLEEDPALSPREIDFTQFEGYGNDDSLGENVTTLPLHYSFAVQEGLDSDSVYEILNVIYEHTDQLSDTHDYYSYFSEDEWWLLGSHPDYPFHPGAAEFYREKGLWNEDFVVYEE